MATGVQVLKSTDASAPVLTGAAGALITVLDACLVNGYGAKIAIGAGGAGAWAKAFTGANKAVYRPSAGNRLYLRVQDDALGTGGAKEALIKGAESFSDVDTATNPLPTVAQSALTSNSLVGRKSATADATARAWICIGDDRTVYFFAATGDTAGKYLGWTWGDFYSNLAADGYRTHLVARSIENDATAANDRLDIGSSSVAVTTAGHYFQRNRNGGVGAVAYTPQWYSPGTSIGTLGLVGSTIVYPNGEDGGLYLEPVHIFDPTTGAVNSYRGRLRGLYNNWHPVASFTDGDTFSGVGDFAGKSFLVIKSSGSGGVYVAETSDTWEVSS